MQTYKRKHLFYTHFSLILLYLYLLADYALYQIAVMLVLSVIMNLLGVGNYLTSQGLDYNALMVFCLLYGMGFSFVSLFISKWMAKRAMGVRTIEHPSNAQEVWLMNAVKDMSQKAGIGMPEVGIFSSAQPNAFATGWNRNDSLVAVSTGLLSAMKNEEVEAVLGHEIGHIANGDMVTLTLIQGVVNAFVMFFARVVGYAVANLTRDENGNTSQWAFMGATFVAEIVFGVLASTIVMWFSRLREYRADVAGATLASKQSMIGALQQLKRYQENPSEMPSEMVAFGISGESKMAFSELFMSHPPLEKRIAALQNAA
jgi:heat shock protein HtpX